MAKKRGRKRTRIEINRDRKRIADLYIQGMGQYAIADEMGLSQQQISYDLKKIKEEWRESRLQAFDEHIERELAKIDKVELEAWAAYERSQRSRKRATKRDETGGNNKHIDAVEVQERDGDPKWLDVVMRCIDRRCKLLGLDAPEKLEHSGKVEMESDLPVTGFAPEIYQAAQDAFIHALNQRQEQQSAGVLH